MTETTMSLSAAVAAQFKLILRHKCMSSSPQWTAGCVFHLSTAAFGYFLIVVVALAQLPVLFRILKYTEDKSLINPFSIGLMAFMASNNVAYAVNKNLAISTWGEGVLQLVQYLIIINILFIHQGRHRQAVAFTLFYVTAMVGSLTPVMPDRFLLYLKFLNIPIDIAQKTALMYRCHKHGGPVSPVSSRRSIALLNLCALGRLLTACLHSNDLPLIVAYGQESLMTLALTTVAMVARRRRKRMMRKLSAMGEEEGDLSSGLEDMCVREGGRRRMRLRRKLRKNSQEEEEGETSSGMESSTDRETKKRRRLRSGNNQWREEEEEEDGEMSSGLEELARLECRKEG